MTVSSTISQIEYAGDGSTVAFPTTFEFLATGDLDVVLRDSNGLETTLTETTHYTVTGAGDDAGGTVTMVTAPASGEVLAIRRDTAKTQGIDYVENDPFPAETHEAGLDRLTMIAQENGNGVARAIVAPVTDTDPKMELPIASERANQFAAFDSNGNVIVASGTAGADTALRTDLGSITVASKGSTLVGVFRSITGFTGRTLAAWIADRPLSVKDFGAVGDGVTDDTAAFSSAIAYINSQGGGSLIIPKTSSFYLLWWDYDTYYDGVSIYNNETSFVDCDGVNIISDGASIKIKDNAKVGIHSTVYKDEGYVFVFENCNNVKVTGVLLDGNLANLNIGTADGNCTGISMRGCRNVLIENAETNYFGTDGIITQAGNSGSPANSERVTLVNVKSGYNRRQGWSITGLKGGSADNCSFSYTGRGAYSTAPSSGVDFEPTGTGAVVENITFTNCTHYDNLLTGHVADSNLTKTRDLAFINCRFEALQVTASAVWMRIASASYLRCYISGRLVNFYGRVHDSYIYHDDSTGGGDYAIENSTANTPCLIQDSEIVVSEGARLFNFQGSMTDETITKVIENCVLTVEDSTLASATWFAILREAKLIDSVVNLTGTPPASPYYLSNTLGVVLGSYSVSSDMTLASSSAGSSTSGGTNRHTNLLALPTQIAVAGITIVTGVLTITSSYTGVDTEAAAASDDLDTINGGVGVAMLVIHPQSSARSIVVKHGTGNIYLNGAVDYTMDSNLDTLMLVFDPLQSKWLEIGRGNNGV